MTSADTTVEPIEQVLVVPTLLFHELGYFQGFCANVTPYLKTLFDQNFTSFRPRDQMEQDPSFKQLIPYCIFRCAGEYFFYTRGKAQGEGRLHSKRSIGVGGHISSTDARDRDVPYLQAMHREIEEEVYLETGYREACWGLLNDDQTEVGRVHLGIVHIFELEAPKVRPREKSIIEAGFAPLAELLQARANFETWSQICLDQLAVAEA